MLLHQYATAPGGAAYGYDAAGRLASLTSDNRSYIYDALGRLKEVRLDAGVNLSDMSEIPAGAETKPIEHVVYRMQPEIPAGAETKEGTWDVTNDYLAETSSEPGRILWPPPAGMQQFSFTYWTAHDPEDPDGNPSTDDFGPEYYATAILRATQYTEPPELEDEWRYLGLVIQPDGLYLREWDADSVTELGGVAVAIPHGQWHDVTIEIGGEEGTTVTVKHLRSGADEAESFEAETTIPGGGRIGFGVGESADFRFDDVGTREDVTLAASTALRYHYDANGRVVGRTLDPDGTPESQFFIYDGDRIIQELDENGDLVAAWDYGVYIDEILVMYRDVEPPAGLEPYYYLQDDHYNVIALADATGAVVERYAYDDYGASTNYNGDGTATRATSAYFNPFLFQGRRWDEVLGLYDYHTRYHDPALGRFLRIGTIRL